MLGSMAFLVVPLSCRKLGPPFIRLTNSTSDASLPFRQESSSTTSPVFVTQHFAVRRVPRTPINGAPKSAVEIVGPLLIMFNALNRFISRLDGDTQPRRDQQSGGYGFQVLRNTNLELGVEPWFDFIVGINGRVIVCWIVSS